MRIRWGNYRHRIAEVDLQISRQTIENAMKVALAVIETWVIQGKLYNLTGDRTSMYNTLRDFEAAYSVNGKDLVLEYSNGRAGWHALYNSECIGGTRVVEKPSFPSGKRGEHLTFRSYRVVVQGIRPLSRSQYLSFSERISIRGGGAKWGCLEVNQGMGVRQLLRTHTTCTATQSGSAVGYLQQPEPPPPIWPWALVNQYPDIDVDGPQTIGEDFNATQTNFGISWSYEYQATGRLFGTPHFLRGF